MDKNKKIEALYKLIGCDKLANDKFKDEYRIYFNLDDYDNNIPNLGQFVNKPPLESKDKKRFDFWKAFCTKYPNSDNKEFQKIYLTINKDCIQYCAHFEIHNIEKDEFDDLMKFGLPDIYSNTKLCNDYKEWLYLF
ncbi:hypothetical protein BMW23_1064 [Bodo saltans virus]|uniref:Uncharacterized protein n=1 Tax=Bodo saltans virus TaxID=2024608 RepID=A0A2H4UVZ1_9VIRU|nr:hypothetical protein QJ851_gp1045 [Bodo saltans virus]ATZ81108.1 hypothetical protein BMW23_1064 [Bodo saltans virus]